MMQKAPIASPPPPISLGDIYYVLFKHKWKIAILSAVGLIGALLIFVLAKPAYVSEAKLLVRYVEDAKAVGDEKIRPMPVTTDAIMNAEASILSSLDVASAV